MYKTIALATIAVLVLTVAGTKAYQAVDDAYEPTKTCYEMDGRRFCEE